MSTVPPESSSVRSPSTEGRSRLLRAVRLRRERPNLPLCRGRSGGPGQVSLMLLGGELLVLVMYLLAAQVLTSNPFIAALVNGAAGGYDPGHGPTGVLARVLAMGLHLWLAMLWLLTVGLMATGGGYRLRLNLSVWEQLPALGWRAGLALAGTVAAADRISGSAARDAVAILGLAGMASHLVVRIGVFGLLRETRDNQRTVSRALVIGGGTLSFKLVQLLETQRDIGLLVLGYLDDTPHPLPSGPAGWNYLGQVHDLPEVVRRLRIQTVVVGLGAGSDAPTAQAVRLLAAEGVRLEVFAIPRLFDLGHWPLGQDHVGPVPLARARTAALSGPR